MSEIEQLKNEVQELRKQLQSSKDMSKMYLQNVAHQLTAPLGAIKWSIEAMKDDTIPLTRKGNLIRSVYSQATILVHLIKNFALMSNLEADEQLGQMRNQDPTDLMLLAINLANDFQPQAFDVDKKIVVDNESFVSSIGKRKVKAERNLVAQAISNLLENAVKYADGNTTITIRAEKQEGVGIAVISDGIPVTAAEKDKIFERGVRGATAKQKVPAGTGIGLYLVMRVMQLHEGRVTLDANGKRSQFTLIFPRNRIT